jgi:peptide deformylase
MQRQQSITKAELQSKEFQEKLTMLPKTMKHYGGIGIAAPQIGWWTRVFCFGIEGTNPRYPNATDLELALWINPVITWRSTETNWMLEGCLSVPGMRGWVERPSEVKLSGWDSSGMEKEQHLKGLAARVAQHELDHLDGILFPHRVPEIGFLVPHASIVERCGWAEGWPSVGSYKTALGELCNER